MSATILAWAFLICGYLLPLFHVALSPRSGPWRPPPASRCPLGPRAGWLVMVLLLGPIGWLMFFSARHRRRAAASGDGTRQDPQDPTSRPNA